MKSFQKGNLVFAISYFLLATSNFQPATSAMLLSTFYMHLHATYYPHMLLSTFYASFFSLLPTYSAQLPMCYLRHATSFLYSMLPSFRLLRAPKSFEDEPEWIKKGPRAIEGSQKASPNTWPMESHGQNLAKETWRLKEIRKARNVKASITDFPMLLGQLSLPEECFLEGCRIKKGYPSVGGIMDTMDLLDSTLTRIKCLDHYLTIGECQHFRSLTGQKSPGGQLVKVFVTLLSFSKWGTYGNTSARNHPSSLLSKKDASHPKWIDLIGQSFWAHGRGKMGQAAGAKRKVER